MWISVIMSSCCGGPPEYLAPFIWPQTATSSDIFLLTKSFVSLVKIMSGITDVRRGGNKNLCFCEN